MSISMIRLPCLSYHVIPSTLEPIYSGSCPVKEVVCVLMDTMQIVLSEGALAQSIYLRGEKNRFPLSV